MFCSKERLVKRSGKKGVDRPLFIIELVKEYKSIIDLGEFLSWLH